MDHRRYKSRHGQETQAIQMRKLPVADEHDLLPKDHDEQERARRVEVYARHMEVYGQIRYDLLGPGKDQPAPDTRRLFRLDGDIVEEGEE